MGESVARGSGQEMEPVMGVEPMTPVLPRLCATTAPHGHEPSSYKTEEGSEGFEPSQNIHLICTQARLTTPATARTTRPSLAREALLITGGQWRIRTSEGGAS